MFCVLVNNPVPVPRPAPKPVAPKAPPPPRVPAPAAAGCPKVLPRPPKAGVEVDVAVEQKPPKVRAAGFDTAAALPKPPNVGAATDVEAPNAGATVVAAPKVGAATVDDVGPKLKAGEQTEM